MSVQPQHGSYFLICGSVCVQLGEKSPAGTDGKPVEGPLVEEALKRKASAAPTAAAAPGMCQAPDGPAVDEEQERVNQVRSRHIPLGLLLLLAYAPVD
jgi:hypothetical protein